METAPRPPTVPTVAGICSILPHFDYLADQGTLAAKALSVSDRLNGK